MEEEDVIDSPPSVEVDTPLDSDINLDTERLEQMALNLATAMPIRSLPKQEYIQSTVVPILLEGISWIIKERPEDPVESLAMFLIKNNPMTSEKPFDLSEYE